MEEAAQNFVVTTFAILSVDSISEILKNLDPEDVLALCELYEMKDICSNEKIWQNMMRVNYPGFQFTENPREQFIALTNGSYTTFVAEFKILDSHTIVDEFKIISQDERHQYENLNDFVFIEILGNNPKSDYWVAFDTSDGRVFREQNDAISYTIERFTNAVEEELNDCVENLTEHLPDDIDFCLWELEVNPHTYNNIELLNNILEMGNVLEFTDSSGYKQTLFVKNVYLG